MSLRRSPRLPRRAGRCENTALPGRAALLGIVAASVFDLASPPLRPSVAFARESHPTLKLEAICWDFKGSSEWNGHPDFDVPDLAGAGLPGVYTAGLASPTLGAHGNPTCMAARATAVDWSDNVTPTTDDVSALDFPLSIMTGFATAGTFASSPGTILKTVNAGMTWTIAHTVTRALTDIDMVDESAGWAVGLRGSVLKTIDGGATWTPQFTDGTSIHYAICALDASTAYIAADLGVVFKTVDGGTNWAVIGNAATGTTNTLRGIEFLDALHGFAAGSNGTVLKTSDGGATWTVSNPVAADLRGIHIHDADNAWVAGNAGTILRTADAGATWTAQAPGTAANLNDIDFSNDGLGGFVVGNGGVIRQTHDGGATWSASASGTADLNDVIYLPQDGTAVAAADGGIVKSRARTGTLVTTNWIHSAGPAEAREMFEAPAEDTGGTYNGLHQGFITGAETMRQWFTNVPGTNMSTVIGFTFQWVVAGYYLSSTVDFAPIDGMLFGKSPGEPHNCDFTVKCVWQFTYDQDTWQWFSYRGNDDCWIYVDDRLVLDMGGTHAPAMQFIDFDRLGLSDGEEYEMHIFMAKRRHRANLVQMATNVVFRAVKTPSISQIAD